MATDQDWEAMWTDQVEFNRELRPDPQTMTEAQKSELTSDLSLHLINEIGELLRHVKWKKNRRNRSTANPVMVREELIDIFKLWMSIAQVWEPDMARLVTAYWEKSEVVRRRHAEEFILNSRRPSAIIDLDGVVADFVNGARQWMTAHNYRTVGETWIDGELPRAAWKYAKHNFYLAGGFRTLPLIPGAKEFIDWCRDNAWNVIFMTSRGIDRYPNILTDTIYWMKLHELKADFVWWGGDKPAKLEQEEVLEHVKLAVDDDLAFVEQYVEAKVKNVIWLKPGLPEDRMAPYWRVPSLSTIMEYYHGIQ